MKKPNVKQVVHDYLMADIEGVPRLKRLLQRGWSTTKLCDDFRRPIWENCLTLGINKSLERQTEEVIRQINLVPLQAGFGDIEVKTRLTEDTWADAIAAYPARRSRGDHLPVNEHSKAAGLLLSATMWQLDEEITDIHLAIYKRIEAMTVKEGGGIEKANIFIPARCFEEINRVGFDDWCSGCLNQDDANRMYADTRGTFHPMWDQPSRARVVSPVWRTTDLAKHEEYLKREHGLTSSMVADILKDPVEAWFAGFSEMAITQSISWYRIASTGKTNIPVAMDAVASGYAHMLAMMRDDELFIRAFPFEGHFVHPHNTLGMGLRKATNALRTLTLTQIKPLSKFVFTPCMYGAGKTGLFSHATGERAPEDLCDAGDWEEFKLPPLMDAIIGDLPPEEQAAILEKQCQEWAAVFRRKLPKVSAFGDYWVSKWKAEANATGMWFVGPNGEETLCPRMRRDKHTTVEYRARWFEDKERVEDTVSLFAARADDKGTAVSSSRIRVCDSFTAADCVIESKGKVLASIHDSMMFMLADEDLVQCNYTQGFVRTHARDVMGKGTALDIDIRRKMLR